MSYIVKVESGKVKVYEGKTLKGTLGNGKVVAACCNDEWVFIVEKGQVAQYAIATRSRKRTLGSGDSAIDVTMNGDRVVVEYANGKHKEYDAKTGSHKRTF